MVTSSIRGLNHPDADVTSDTEQRRMVALRASGLLASDSIPVFEEATQIAAHFLDAPICILGVIDGDRHWFRSAVGLSRIGLMNDLASSRQIPRRESFCQYVVEHQTILAIENTTQHPEYESFILVRRYGIKAYLGVPLLTSEGHCLGSLAIMELQPRSFTAKDIAFLELIARWCMSEFERNQLLKIPPLDQVAPPLAIPTHDEPLASLENAGAAPESTLTACHIATNPSICVVKANLIAQMVQELQTPLTTTIGMASVLNREIYGPLTSKQKEYLNIVHHNSQYMHSLVNEIVELGDLNEQHQDLELNPVDIEMLCQQSLATLENASKRRDQRLHLTVEPNRRMWLLDKNKVRQMLYHLIFRVIQSSNAGSTVRLHVSRKEGYLSLSVWTSHPWLGEGLPQAEIATSAITISGQSPSGRSPQAPPSSLGLPQPTSASGPKRQNRRLTATVPAVSVVEDLLEADSPSTPPEAEPANENRCNLGLILSQKLAELHGGSLSIQGSLDAGYRYVITLPQIELPSND